jgi:hypothetical protein
MDSREPESIPISSIRVEDGARDLVRSEKMKPYLELLKAQIGGHDTGPLVEALAAVPLEDRYAWRVMSALKWAFCDLETENLIADLETLSAADVKKLIQPLQMRTLQFSIFILTMLGEEVGEQLILHALQGAKASIGAESGD